MISPFLFRRPLAVANRPSLNLNAIRHKKQTQDDQHGFTHTI